MPRIFKLTGPIPIILAVVLLLIFLHRVGVLSPIENIILTILSPIQRTVYGTGTYLNNSYQSVVTFRSEAKENTQLRERVRQLAEENAQLRVLFSDQQALALQERFLTEAGYHYIPTHIIGKNPEANFQAMIIDKGSRDGIAIGMPVVVGAGIMVGTIFHVNDYTAEVLMVNDSRSRIASVIENDQGSQGVVIGEHGLSLKMELIPQGDTVKPGNTVVTSGLELTIPRGLVLGEVSRVEVEPTSLFQIAYLKPFIKNDSLTVVSVIGKNNGATNSF